MTSLAAQVWLSLKLQCKGSEGTHPRAWAAGSLPQHWHCLLAGASPASYLLLALLVSFWEPFDCLWEVIGLSQIHRKPCILKDEFRTQGASSPWSLRAGT